MHVFTKLEFGEYVFLLLSRKIEISYKAKNESRKRDPYINTLILCSAPYIPCLILSSPRKPVSPVFTYCITFCQKQKEARGEDRLSYRDSSFRGPETAILFHTLSDLKRHLYASASQSFCKTVRILNVSHRRIAV